MSARMNAAHRAAMLFIAIAADADAMSDAIYSIGRHKALSDMLCEKGKAEVAALTWDKAADKLSELYNQIANKTPQI